MHASPGSNTTSRAAQRPVAFFTGYRPSIIPESYVEMGPAARWWRRASPAYTWVADVQEAPSAMFSDPFSTFFLYEPWELVIEMGLIWLAVFLIFRFLRGTRGAGVIRGFAMLLALFVVLQLIVRSTGSLGRLQILVDVSFSLLAILLMVIFQPELRQAAIRIGQARFLRSSREPRKDFVESIGEAVDFLSKNQFARFLHLN